MKIYDIAIVGGGIVGCFIARELSRYRLSMAVCEKETDIGVATTKANSGLVHGGYDPKPGTLKAKLNVEGNRRYAKIAEELGFAFRRNGSLVLGFSENDRPRLEALAQNALANGLADCRLIERAEILKLEPAANPEAILAFYCPHTGAVDPFDAAAACMENAVANGADLYLQSPVSAIVREGEHWRLRLPHKEIGAAYVINAAGLYADEVARLAGAGEYTISARHGDMLMLDKECGHKPKMALYPVPTPVTKGVIVSPTLHNSVLIGATASPGTKEDMDSYAAGVAELLSGALRLAPGLNPAKVIRPFAGERAVVDDHDNDFYIRPASGVPGFFHVAGIQSPGIAAAPAIGLYVVEMLRDYGVPLAERPDFEPRRAPRPVFSALSRAEQAELIRANPAYGHIVCRCETVTEAEIVAAIRTDPPAVSLDAIKRRTRAGMGRCQSGFCQSRVLRILSRELGKKPEEILLEYAGSEVVLGEVKGERP